MPRRRKPGRPKGSKNKKKRSSKRRSKATAAQLRNLKKARAALQKKRGKKSGKSSKGKRKGKRKATAKQLANLKLARAARELKRMPKTVRNHLKNLHHDMMADTVRAPIFLTGAPSILRRVRRHSPTLISG